VKRARLSKSLIGDQGFLGTLGTLATGVIAVAHASKGATAIAALITATGYLSPTISQGSFCLPITSILFAN